MGFRRVVLASRVEREALHLGALLGQPAHEGEEARLGDVELLVAAIPHVRAQLELAEELLVRVRVRDRDTDSVRGRVGVRVRVGGRVRVRDRDG